MNSTDIDVLIMKYKTTKRLLEVDVAFCIKYKNQAGVKIAREKITLIKEFLVDLG